MTFWLTCYFGLGKVCRGYGPLIVLFCIDWHIILLGLDVSLWYSSCNREGCVLGLGFEYRYCCKYILDVIVCMNLIMVLMICWYDDVGWVIGSSRSVTLLWRLQVVRRGARRRVGRSDAPDCEWGATSLANRNGSVISTMSFWLPSGLPMVNHDRNTTISPLRLD